MLKKTVSLLACFSLLLSACSPAPQSYQQQLVVFGTIVDITVWDVDEEKAQQAVTLIDRDFQRMHYEWHAWEPGPLTEINQSIASGKPATVIPSLLPIIERSRLLYHQSDGLFNPAIGGLLNLWGFQSSDRPHRPPPAKEKIQALVDSNPGMDDVIINNGTLTSGNRTVQFDFGAFAKGYAIDLAIEQLRKMGIENAIVNGGGDLRAIGRKGERPWRVGIRHPQGQGVLAALEVAGDESVFTSGNYERFNEFEGVRYTHILDPRSGWPVKGITSVTVIHHNGADADAAATALVVAGVKEWYRIAQQMGIKYAMLVDEDGTVYMNPAMARRIEFQPGDEQKVVLSEPL